MKDIYIESIGNRKPKLVKKCDNGEFIEFNAVVPNEHNTGLETQYKRENIPEQYLVPYSYEKLQELIISHKKYEKLSKSVNISEGKEKDETGVIQEVNEVEYNELIAKQISKIKNYILQSKEDLNVSVSITTIFPLEVEDILKNEEISKDIDLINKNIIESNTFRQSREDNLPIHNVSQTIEYILDLKKEIEEHMTSQEYLEKMSKYNCNIKDLNTVKESFLKELDILIKIYQKFLLEKYEIVPKPLLEEGKMYIAYKFYGEFATPKIIILTGANTKNNRAFGITEDMYETNNLSSLDLIEYSEEKYESIKNFHSNLMLNLRKEEKALERNKNKNKNQTI